MKRSPAICLALCVLMAAPNVYADPEKAAEFYKQASDAYASGRLQEAADLLERAFAEEPDLVYQYNRILAFEGLKDFPAALRLIDIYKDPMLRDEDNRFGDIEAIRQRILDGQEVQRLLAEKQAEDPEKREDPEKLEDPDPKPIQEPESSTNWLAIGLVGGGAVVLGVGSLFASGLLVSDELDNTQCVNDNLKAGSSGESLFEGCAGYANLLNYNARSAQYEDEKSSIESQQLMSIVFLSAGAVLATSGILVWALSDSPETSAQIIPYLAPDRAGAAVNVQF